jgi:hypothetical protein
MKYEAVYLYTSEGLFIGVSIRKADTLKLHDTNIWTQSSKDIEDFKQTLARLNDEDTLRHYWPDAFDKEVTDLVEDPTWEPLELHEESVPNWAESTLVYKKVSAFGYDYDSTTDSVQPKPNPETGRVEWRQSDEIDDDATIIIYEQKKVPDPQEVQNRFFKAQEIVARRRAAAFATPA